MTNSTSGERGLANLRGLVAGGCIGLLIGASIIGAVGNLTTPLAVGGVVARYVALGFLPLIALAIVIGAPLLKIARREGRDYSFVTLVGMAVAGILGMIGGVIVGLIDGGSWWIPALVLMVLIATWTAAWALIPGRWLSRHPRLSAVVIATTACVSAVGAVQIAV